MTRGLRSSGPWRGRTALGRRVPAGYGPAPVLRPAGARRRGGKLRLLFAAGMALFALVSYFGSRVYNPVTGEQQYLSITPRQEIALGLQAAPQMIAQHGGLHPDPSLQQLVDQVGVRLVRQSAAAETAWQWEFHLLDDPDTVNAFALPGGQVFLTEALLRRFRTEGQLAGVLGHEIGHVVARHSAQRIAKSELTQGLTGAVLVASGDGAQGAARTAAMIGQLVQMKFGREDELQSDRLGVQFMADAGYDPRALVEVMRILEQASQGARPAEFFSTHPSPDNRIAEIDEAIRQRFPDGVPAGLIP